MKNENYKSWEEMQVKTGQEMQEFSHFETLKGAFNQNQVLQMASGDGPRWS